VAAIVPLDDPDSFYDRVLEAIVGPSLKAADRDLSTGRVVNLKEWQKRRAAGSKRK
jgi:hypothetical protein